MHDLISLALIQSGAPRFSWTSGSSVLQLFPCNSEGTSSTFAEDDSLCVQRAQVETITRLGFEQPYTHIISMVLLEFL